MRGMTMIRAACVAAIAAGALLGPATRASAQAGMPDPRQMSGIPLPSPDLPAGTVSVRVIRGSVSNNLPNVDVTFAVDGKARTVKTGADGRAQIAGLPAGAHVKATAVVSGERLETQDITISTTGVRFILAASASGAAAPQGAPAAPAAAAAAGPAGMPDPSQIAGIPLESADLPAGTVSVRVIRGSFANNIAGVDVGFVVDGKTRTVKTGADGRAQVAGLTAGAHVKAETIVGTERLESQEFTIAGSGIRIVLVAGAGGAGASAGMAPQRGTVTLGADSRIVADFSSDQLNLYYVLKIVNGTLAPVDIGGPLVVQLPPGARSVSMLEDSTPQATASGERVTITGPFAPGTTSVNLAFELPYSGDVAHVEQHWPAALESLSLFVLKSGNYDLQSPQLSSKQSITEQGQPVVAGAIGAIPAGGVLTFDVTGLPHHALWPRYLALTLAGTVVMIGIWAAAVAKPARRAA